MLKPILLTSLLLLIFSGCNENKPQKNYDAKKLIVQKCASCHNLNMPPIISDNELAPPMMAISFHIHNFMKPSNESQRTADAIAFVADYVRYPSLKKSFCDKKSIQRYGLMPSQKESVTEDEVKAIASYMFTHYTQEKLSKVQKEQEKYNALAQGHKIALKYRCLGCHSIDKKIVGPSLIDIAQKYDTTHIQKSIKNGSHNRWKNANGATMPSFKDIGVTELNELSSWLIKLK
ncbi:MAG: c-type cytochrome [Campylobacterota bacterium]|nr:c-type cytochrome [Campylobacterota bacterium]